MKRVMVSGCYDILHAGHVTFFEDAKAAAKLMLGDEVHLTVCIASDRVIRSLKGREPSSPQSNRKKVIEALHIVDSVLIGDDEPEHMNFASDLKRYGYHALVCTEDDKYQEEKTRMCEQMEIPYLILDKRPPECEPMSTTIARRKASLPAHVPLRVDFAGGWLDVPQYARDDGYIVNCAISPTVSLDDWQYEKRSGLGGSAAHSMLRGEDPIEAELQLAGWQDPAIIQETGVCVWKPGPKPRLYLKSNGEWLRGRMALMWTGKHHDTKHLLTRERNYEAIAKASREAAGAVLTADVMKLGWAVHQTYEAQLAEGMEPIVVDGPEAELDVKEICAKKYVGSGHGGYVLYLFKEREHRDMFVYKCDIDDKVRAIEPYEKWDNAR